MRADMIATRFDQKIRVLISLCWVCFLLLSWGTVYAQQTGGHDHSMHTQHSMTDNVIMPDLGDDKAKAEQAKRDLLSTGVDEKPGETIALDATFRDENGNTVRLGDLVDKPTVILPIFFYCPVVCPMLLSNLAGALTDVPFEPGKAYRVIALSFNDEETPEVAKDSKADYMALLPETFPVSAWTFLTGDQKNILAFTDSIGYRFKKTAPSTFVHPNAMVIVSGEGKIIRYLYGSTYLGSDIGMGIAEAQKGIPGISIKRILSFCFNYDPAGRRYIIMFFKGVAFLTVLLLVLFFIFFLRRKDTREEEIPKHPEQNDADSQPVTRNTP